MSKMTDEQIINALKKYIECAEGTQIARDVGGTLVISLLQNAFDLINRQQETIETLRSCVEQHHIMRKDGKSPLSLLAAEIKSEAIKEFAERLKKTIKKSVDDAWHSDGNGIYDAENVLDDIDNLVKEMVGETDV